MIHFVYSVLGSHVNALKLNTATKQEAKISLAGPPNSEQKAKAIAQGNDCREKERETRDTETEGVRNGFSKKGKRKGL